jgi:hypothetical protein
MYDEPQPPTHKVLHSIFVAISLMIAMIESALIEQAECREQVDRVVVVWHQT